MRKIQIAGYSLESADIENQEEVIIRDGDALQEATEALEAFALLLQPATEGASVDPRALNAVAAVTNRLVTRAKLPQLSVGCESIAVDTVQQAASLGLEDIKAHLKNAYEAVKAFLIKIGTWITEKVTAMWETATSALSRAKASISKAKFEAFNSKKLIDVSVFHVNGKLNGKTTADSLLWATSEHGFAALAGDFVVGAKIGVESAAYADKLTEGAYGTPECMKHMHDLIKELAGEVQKGCKVDSEGYVTTFVSRQPLKLKINDVDAPRFLETEHGAGESKKVETTLEKLGITKDVADKLAANLDGMQQFIEAQKQIAKQGRKFTEKLAKELQPDNKDAAKYMQRLFTEVFAISNFQNHVARGTITAVHEISRAVNLGLTE